MLEVGKTYKYKELCSLMGQNEKTGKSKQLQIKDWKRYFDWKNPTTQKYEITEVYDEPKKKIDNRGKTEKKLVDEFPILWDSFIQQNRNEINSDVYFSYGKIVYYFGFYNKRYDEVHKNDTKELKKLDPQFDSYIYHEVTEKIRSLVYSWVINKIKKDTRLNYGYGVLGRRYDNYENEQLDELLEEYEKFQASWLEQNNYKHMAQVIQHRKYHLMYGYIKNHLNEYIMKNNEEGDYPEEGYKEIQRLHKIHLHRNQTFQKYDTETIQQARLNVNKQLCDALIEYYSQRWDKLKEEYKEVNFLFDCGMPPELPVKYTYNKDKDLAPYKHIIDTYIRLKE